MSDLYTFYCTFFAVLLYISKTAISWIKGVVRPVTYSNQGGMYSRMYSKTGLLYIGNFFLNKVLQKKCIVSIVNFRKVHKEIYNKDTLRKRFLIYIKTVRTFTIHTIHRAIQGGKR